MACLIVTSLRFSCDCLLSMTAVCGWFAVDEPAIVGEGWNYPVDELRRRDRRVLIPAGASSVTELSHAGTTRTARRQQIVIPQRRNSWSSSTVSAPDCRCTPV